MPSDRPTNELLRDWIIEAMLTAPTDEPVAIDSAWLATIDGKRVLVASDGIPPAFTSQPTSQNKTVGDTVSFSYAATNSTSAQWRENGVPISGATSSPYTFIVEAGDDSNEYDVVLTGPGGTTTSNTVTLTVGGPTVFKSGTNLYVRQPLWSDADTDIITLILYGQATSDTTSGNIDFRGRVFASHATTDMVTAYNAGNILSGGNDNGTPVRYNDMYLAGGHGIVSFHITSTGHGLTSVDVGDVGVIAGKSWVLVKIVDANTLWVVAANTGSNVNLWTINGTPSATGTITFSGAGAKAYTARTSTQTLPLVKNPVRSILVDGIEVSGDGPYTGRAITVTETYDVPNPAQWLLDLIASKGAASPVWITDPSVASQMRVTQSWTYDRFGGCVGDYNATVLQTVKFATSGAYNYMGAWQHQGLSKLSHTLFQYIPDLTGTVGGYDFKNIADISANAATVVVDKTDSANQSDPPSHFAMLLKTGGNLVLGLAYGYLRTRGQGIPANRSQNTHLWQMSPAKKQYPVAVDGTRYAGQNIPASTSIDMPFWVFGYRMNTHPTYTVDACYEDAGKLYRVIDVHDTLANVMIDMPAGLEGQAITVISKSSSCTVHSSTVGASGVEISISGGWGRMILEVPIP